MSYQHNPGWGTLFPNRYKVEGDKKPDWKGGICTPGGEQLEMALWFGKTVKGDNKASVKVSEPGPPPQEGNGSSVQNALDTQPQTQPPAAYDDIPF